MLLSLESYCWLLWENWLLLLYLRRLKLKTNLLALCLLSLHRKLVLKSRLSKSWLRWYMKCLLIRLLWYICLEALIYLLGSVILSKIKLHILLWRLLNSLVIRITIFISQCLIPWDITLWLKRNLLEIICDWLLQRIIILHHRISDITIS